MQPIHRSAIIFRALANTTRKASLITSALLFLAAAIPAGAADTFLKATVTGTVQTQVLFTPSDGRIRTEPLNNKRIFREFLVSPTDYALVFRLGSGIELVLVPKHASAMLPSITVIGLGNDIQQVVNTKTRVVRIVSNLAPGTATNLFKDLAGELNGTLHYTGAVAAGTITKFVFSVLGHGTDPTNGAGKPALLKFKATTGSPFVQAP